MTFEGEQKIIPIKGIERAGADNLCEDGAMNEVIGLEYKDGSYVPYAPDSCVKEVPDGTVSIRVHKTSVQTNVLALTESGELFFMSKSDFDEGTGDWTYVGNNVSSFEFVGNILCTDKLDYFYYSESENKYVTYAVKPNGADMVLPTVLMRVTSRSGKKMTESAYGSSGELICAKGSSISNLFADNPSFTSVENRQREFAKYTALKALDFAQRKGRLYGYVLAVYAYELMNGEFIHASAPILLGAPCVTNPNPDMSHIYVNTNFLDSKDMVNFYMYPFGHRCFDSSRLNKEWDPIMPLYEDEEVTSDYKATIGKFDKNNGSFIEEIEDIENVMPEMWGWYQNPTTYCITGGKAVKDSFPVFCIQSNSFQYKIDSDIQNKFKGQIKSVCIFISKQISPYKYAEDENNIILTDTCVLKNVTSSSGYFTTTRNFYVDRKSTDELKEELQDTTDFYLAKRIPFEDIVASDDWITIDLEGYLGDALLTRERLKTTSFDKRENVSGHLHSYNERLLLYNYVQKLFRGNKLDDFQLNGGIGQYSLPEQGNILFKCVVEISPSSGEDGSIVEIGGRVTSNWINPFLSYPSGDAKSITIYARRLFSQDTRYYKQVFPLKDSGAGYSYYYNGDNYIDILKGELVDESETDVVASNTIKTYKNGIIATDTYDPSYFNKALSYRIGNDEIIGLSSLSIALSQDTFGRFPLIAFCTDGTYSLETDTSGGAIKSVAPFAREVCSNKNSICSIDGAVVFASDKGLVCATSNGVVDFNKNLNGVPNHFPSTDVQHGNGLKLYNDAISNDRVVILNDSISYGDFIDFVQDKDTFVSYASKKGKLIIYNKNYDFSYWLDIRSRNVTKLHVKLGMGDGNYPEERYYYVENDEATEFIFPYRSNHVNIDCLFQTRPVKIISGLKTTFRVVLRGEFYSYPEGSASHPSYNYAELFVLGSLDGEHWQLIGAKEKKLTSVGMHDLGCTTERVSCNYIMVIFAGKLLPNSHVDSIEITDMNKYNNKLK